jgi:Kelch motif
MPIRIKVLATLLLLCGLPTSQACTEHKHGGVKKELLTTQQKLQGNAFGPAVSGSWFDSNRSGEGLVVQYLPTGGMLVVWFTYPPDGAPGEQAWLISEVGFPNANRVQMRVFQPTGGVFGANFNPAQVQNRDWGTLTLTSTGCNSMTLQYSANAASAGFGSGTRTLSRLSSIDQVDCLGTKKLSTTGARALDGLRGKSGAWFVPSRSGEGWMLEELADGRTVVYWFTYDPQGRQAWTIGIGQRSGNRVQIPDNQITGGARFGTAFDPNQVTLKRWGSLALEFLDCNRLDVTYDGALPGYGTAKRSAERLAGIAGASCIDGTPQPKLAGNWTEGTRLDGRAVSEHAVAALDGKIFVLGGFGLPKGFRRFDPATNAWTTLPDLPAGRDHLAAFALDGGIFYTGGASNGGGDLSISGYRFDLASNTWEARAELPAIFGSHAAVLNGRAYIGDAGGTLGEYDARHRLLRNFAPPDLQERDHSQVVAFQDEIWLISGRFPETITVAIFDPASERWRPGPTLNRARGGFAAAVVDQQIVVSGGEVLGNGTNLRLEASTEVFTAGQSDWKFAQAMSDPVHGIPGVQVGGAFYAISGSKNPGLTSGATGRVFTLRLF